MSVKKIESLLVYTSRNHHSGRAGQPVFEIQGGEIWRFGIWHLPAAGRDLGFILSTF